MRTYIVVATATGTAEVEVEAENEDAAITKAYAEHLTGFSIDGGEVEWDVDYVEELTSDV